MSFSEQFKQELWEEEPPRRPCCRHSLTNGLLFCARAEDGAFYLRAPGGEVGEHMAVYLEKQLRTEVHRTPGSHVGRPYLGLSFVSPKSQARLQRADMSDLPLAVVLGFECEHCTRYFVRGVVIAAGSMTDPALRHHMEISCRDSATARHLSKLLSEVVPPPKVVQRADGPHLYYKNSTDMEDVLSYLHAGRALFALINSKIEREIRNNENRATNCVARNIQKAVTAAAEQQAAIDRLRGSELWDKLPRNLRETASLREQYPDATLAELALLHTPPITKSGLNHRLKKLTELAGSDLPDKTE